MNYCKNIKAMHARFTKIFTLLLLYVCHSYNFSAISFVVGLCMSSSFYLAAVFSLFLLFSDLLGGFTLNFRFNLNNL